MLTLAALDGVAVRPWLLARVLGDGPDPAVLAEEAVAAGVLVAGDGGSGLRFAHDLFCEVLAADLPAPARRRGHRDLGAALESARAEGAVVHPAELAAHFGAAAAVGDAEAGERAVRYAREAAAEAAGRLAFDDALAHLERAQEALDLARPGPPARLALLLELADARRLAGRLADAAATYRYAFAAARQLNDAETAARAAIGLHRVGVKTGPSAERDSHAALLTAAAQALGDRPAPLAARVHAALARTLYHSLEADQMARAVPVAEHAAELARDCGDPEAGAEALLALHDVRWRPGQAGARLEVLGRVDGSASGPDAGGLRHVTRLLRAQALLELGDPARSPRSRPTAPARTGSATPPRGGRRCPGGPPSSCSPAGSTVPPASPPGPHSSPGSSATPTRCGSPTSSAGNWPASPAGAAATAAAGPAPCHRSRRGPPGGR